MDSIYNGHLLDAATTDSGLVRLTTQTLVSMMSATLVSTRTRPKGWSSTTGKGVGPVLTRFTFIRLDQFMEDCPSGWVVSRTWSQARARPSVAVPVTSLQWKAESVL